MEGEHLLQRLCQTEEWIKALDAEMEAETAGDEEIERLQNVPGVGPKTAFAFAAHVGAERFERSGLEKSISKKKAIVAVARRLAELLYAMMRDETWYAYRPFMGSEKTVKEIAQIAMSA